MKCQICSKTIENTFLGKILGTYIKDSKGKLHSVCFECQKKAKTKEELLDAIKWLFKYLISELKFIIKSIHRFATIFTARLSLVAIAQKPRQEFSSNQIKKSKSSHLQHLLNPKAESWNFIFWIMSGWFLYYLL